MATYDAELLKAAGRLLARQRGERGRLADARIRRSISTSYYAIFHFLIDQVTSAAVGAGSDLRVRRRLLARVVTHRTLRSILDKVRSPQINVSLKTFFERGGVAIEAAPLFARNLATTFIDAQAKRESADYDRNEPFSASDARLLRSRVGRVIRGWRRAKTETDRDFKQAFAVLVLLKGSCVKMPDR